MSDGDLADQLATLVDTSVQLVTKVILAVLFRPVRVDILLGTLVRFPTQQHAALLDRIGFLAKEADTVKQLVLERGVGQVK